MVTCDKWWYFRCLLCFQFKKETISIYLRKVYQTSTHDIQLGGWRQQAMADFCHQALLGRIFCGLESPQLSVKLEIQLSSDWVDFITTATALVCSTKTNFYSQWISFEPATFCPTQKTKNKSVVLFQFVPIKEIQKSFNIYEKHVKKKLLAFMWRKCITSL